LLTTDIVGLKSITDELETEPEIYLKIFAMLYADDTIVLAESAEDLQVQLNAFGEYCDNWKMKVNVNKTKIMVLRTSYIALSALSERCFLVTSKLHVFVKITPK
jgi:predicted HTH domain antitoxin